MGWRQKCLIQTNSLSGSEGVFGFNPLLKAGQFRESYKPANEAIVPRREIQTPFLCQKWIQFCRETAYSVQIQWSLSSSLLFSFPNRIFPALLTSSAFHWGWARNPRQSVPLPPNKFLSVTNRSAASICPAAFTADNSLNLLPRHQLSKYLRQK